MFLYNSAETPTTILHNFQYFELSILNPEKKDYP